MKIKVYVACYLEGGMEEGEDSDVTEVEVSLEPFPDSIYNDTRAIRIFEKELICPNL